MVLEVTKFERSNIVCSDHKEVTWDVCFILSDVSLMPSLVFIGRLHLSGVC